MGFWTSSRELKKRTLLAGGPVKELLTRGQDRLTFRPDRNGSSRRGGSVQEIGEIGWTDLPDGPAGEKGPGLEGLVPSQWDGNTGSPVKLIR